MITDSFFAITKNIFADNEIVYISCPITTGERFIHWYSSIGKSLDKDSSKYIHEKTKSVVNPNIRAAKECIKNIRKATNKVIIDPTNLENCKLQWCQNEFYQFWDKFIKDVVDEMILLDGWEYSIGCCCEYLSAIESNIKVYTQNMERLNVEEAKRKMSISIKMYESCQLQDGSQISNILNKLLEPEEPKKLMDKSEKAVLKDEKLHFLISNGIANVAQFVSFEPTSSFTPKFVHINNLNNDKPHTTKEIIEKLILSAPSSSVNIRSFSPEVMKGNRLVFNKTIIDAYSGLSGRRIRQHPDSVPATSGHLSGS